MRYQFVAWAYLIGFLQVVPVPYWILHRLWPKLRADYLYTPIIWCATCLLLYFCLGDPDLYVITILDVLVSASNHPSSHCVFLATHTGWYAKYNYILAATLDAGTQVRRDFPLYVKPHCYCRSCIYLLLRRIRSFW